MTISNEERLERLRVASIFACDRAIAALEEYRQEALAGLPPDDEIDGEFDAIDAKIAAAANKSEIDRQRAGAPLYDRLRGLKTKIKTEAQRQRLVGTMTRLMVELYDMKPEEIDLRRAT